MGSKTGVTLKVNEIFHSIQGESSHAGRPCVFVRLTGCNLRCTYCDTRYAYHEGEDLAVEDILQHVERYACSLVEITGGEPLMQDETPRLAQELLRRGCTVLVETNGSRDISRLPVECVKIVDFKCPSSGELASNDLENISRLGAHDEVKFVMAGREDYEYAVSLARHIQKVLGKDRTILFSAVHGALSLRRLAEWILEDRLSVRLNVQLQKLIWEPDRRGV